MNQLLKNRKQELTNDEWFFRQKPDMFQQYAGEWICISGKKIVSHNHDAGKVLREADRYDDDPIIIKIRKQGVIYAL